MSEYIDNMERVDVELMNDFNKFLGILELGAAPKRHIFDMSGYTQTDELLAIEIKKRNQQVYYDENGWKIVGISISGDKYSGNTLYIDEHKLTSLYLDSVINNSTPLYVNFLDNDFIIVYNLKKIRTAPTKEIKEIWSRGLKKTIKEMRYGLHLSDAYIYRREGDGKYKLYKKPIQCLNPNSN